MGYKELDKKPDFCKIQPEVLEFWEDNHIFEQSVENRTGKEVVFYDGPPFPTGKPHHGTVLVSFIKDMISRYQTMRGFKVPRVWGWDCHGLPIENQAEVLLGINDKNDIEKSLGIDAFNQKCFEVVSNNNESWREYVEQMARWVDYDGAYKTMNLDFMESVIWAFKECYDKGLIYRDYRVTPYCMHCETSLSISDTRESDSTRLRQDRWVIAKFKSKIQIPGQLSKVHNGPKEVYFLAWTTTPWTLPSNLCLAVGADLDYAFVSVDKIGEKIVDEIYVVGKNTISGYEKIFGKEPNIIKECKGSELEGEKYEPLFPYFADHKENGAFRVIVADFVGADDGVGIVHMAPAFGEDDYWACKKNNIPLVNPVDAKGRFTEEITDFYDGKKNVIESNKEIIRFLYDNEKAVADGTVEHNYPHCWRCKEPLIYKAMDAWYFSIDKIKDRLLEHNEKVKWIPETVKHGRFGKWLENARDWNISRNRYWSTPIPIWECAECGERVVLGSIDEIEKASGIRLTNLHRQYMDDVTVTCKRCGSTVRRVPEVLDCWFESGSVPFAGKHYPFENKEWFETHSPSDFVVEYTGQIRCWFYYLHVMSVALFDREAFKNCIVHGTVLAKDGKKLSKSSKNYTDPMELMKQFGTDAFRLYLYQTKAMLIGDLMFDENGIQDALQQIILPYWNACNFYISYANIDGFNPQEVKEPDSDNQLDRWILAEYYAAAKQITNHMDVYQVNFYVENLVSLVEGLTNWYIRRSRRRFWMSDMTQDKKNGYETLYYILVNMTKLFAPVAPILSEKIYKVLTGGYSVHLTDWPEIPDRFKDDELIQKVDLVRNVIYLARSIRNKNGIKNRQPLSILKVVLADHQYDETITEFIDIIAEEINVKKIDIIEDVSKIADVKYDPNFNEIRSRYPERIPEIIKAVKSKQFEIREKEAVLQINGKPESFHPDVILVTYHAKEGMHVASHQGTVVSLDLTVTNELKREGLARDIVRNIQDARKQNGCDITDHIILNIKGEFPEEWIEYVCNETLSEIGEVKKPIAEIEIEEDDKVIMIAFSKKNA